MQKEFENKKIILKILKKEIERLSGEVIPTMMSEMGLCRIKTYDGSHLKDVKRRIVLLLLKQIKKRRLTGFVKMDLGDIIKNEISVSFGRNEDNKAADYAALAQEQGFQPTQKMKVEPMTLKALVRERLRQVKKCQRKFSTYSRWK